MQTTTPCVQFPTTVQSTPTLIPHTIHQNIDPTIVRGVTIRHRCNPPFPGFRPAAISTSTPSLHRSPAMHTIQLHTIPLRNVWMKDPATLDVVMAAAAAGDGLSPAAMTSLVSSNDPIRLPVYDKDQFFTKFLHNKKIMYQCIC